MVRIENEGEIVEMTGSPEELMADIGLAYYTLLKESAKHSVQLGREVNMTFVSLIAKVAVDVEKELGCELVANPFKIKRKSQPGMVTPSEAKEILKKVRDLNEDELDDLLKKVFAESKKKKKEDD